MNARNIAFSILTIALASLAGCAANLDEGRTTRLLRAESAGDLEDCAEPQELCTASYPSTCYWVCLDDPGDDDGCGTEWVCQQSYPAVCREIDRCGSVDSDDCGGVVSGATPDGVEYMVCVDEEPGGTCSSDEPASDDPECGGGSSGGGSGGSAPPEPGGVPGEAPSGS